ncbi:MAG: geobacillin-26 family protein [Lachnospirales bacterium]
MRKKFLSFLLVFCLLFSSSISAATNDLQTGEVIILTNNSKEIVVKEKTDVAFTIVTKNKKNNELLVQKYDNANNLLSEEFLDLNSIEAETNKTILSDPRLFSGTKNQDTFSNREYFINFVTGYWEIRSDYYYKRGFEEDVNNQSYFRRF